MTAINVEQEFKKVLIEAGGEMERSILIHCVAERCGLGDTRVRWYCRQGELSDELIRTKENGKDTISLGGKAMLDSAEAILAIVGEAGGAIDRTLLVKMAAKRAGRCVTSCRTMVRKLVARGDLECEEHSRKQAIIKEPAMRMLMEVLGGARMPEVMRNGREVTGVWSMGE